MEAQWYMDSPLETASPRHLQQIYTNSFAFHLHLDVYQHCRKPQQPLYNQGALASGEHLWTNYRVIMIIVVCLRCISWYTSHGCRYDTVLGFCTLATFDQSLCRSIGQSGSWTKAYWVRGCSWGASQTLRNQSFINETIRSSLHLPQAWQCFGNIPSFSHS